MVGRESLYMLLTPKKKKKTIRFRVRQNCFHQTCHSFDATSLWQIELLVVYESKVPTIQHNFLISRVPLRENRFPIFRLLRLWRFLTFVFQEAFRIKGTKDNSLIDEITLSKTGLLLNLVIDKRWLRQKGLQRLCLVPSWGDGRTTRMIAECSLTSPKHENFMLDINQKRIDNKDTAEGMHIDVILRTYPFTCRVVIMVANVSAPNVRIV